MADDLLTRVIKEIDDRKGDLAGVVREHGRLEAARAALEGMADSGSKGRAAPRRRAPKRAIASRRRPGQTRQRAARGANRGALLKALGKQPGASVPELARRTGISAGVLYQLQRRLVEEGAIKEETRSDGRKGYSLAGG
jgi:transposase-like protein